MKNAVWLRSGLALAILCAVKATAAEAGLQGLAATSPFGQKTEEGAAKGEAQAVEFRGYFREGDAMFFSVYDTVNRHGRWLKLNETMDDLVVREFQPSSEVLSVERNGRKQNLALKASTAVAPRPSAIGAIAKTDSPALAGASGEAPAVAPDSALDEAQRQLAAARQSQAYEERRQRAIERLNARAKASARK